MRLIQSLDVEEQWHAVVRPWLEQANQAAWKDARPTVLLTPSRAESFYLRGRWLQDGGSAFGLRFWTPSDARRFLLGRIPLGLVPAAEPELRLLARVLAQRTGKSTTGTTLVSVERDPGHFLRAYETLLGAGWRPAQEGPSYGRKLARELERTMKEHHVTTQAECHRLLWDAVGKLRAPLLADALLVGFNATHWPLWDLLRAVILSAGEGQVGLLPPRVFADRIDGLWIGSWEQQAGISVEMASRPVSATSSPFTAWVGSYEAGSLIELAACPFHFIAAAQLRTQTEAVVLQVLTYLASERCTRLGIIFPQENPLALSVATELRRLGLPLDDGLGYVQPGPFESRTWAAWIDLQEESSVERLIAWVRAAEAEGLGFGTNLSARDISRALNTALREILVDDLNFLRIHLGESSKNVPIATFLEGRIQLPETAMFRDFRLLVSQAVKQLNWAALDLEKIQQAPWLDEIDGPISLTIFLRWLREATDSRQKVRGAESNHYYGRIHLQMYPHLPGQTWSHLILTGLNEGVWPRVTEAAAFGSRFELEELNRAAVALNRRGTGEGTQGEGHETVLSNRGHCLLPLERRDLALRDLCMAVEATGEAVCLCAATTEGGRPLLPSDFFLHAYRARTGEVLDEMTFGALARQTAEACARHASLFQEAAAEKTDLAATSEAYRERRDQEKPFGRFEFSFAEPPAQPLQLPCKQWEAAWNHPSAVWLERIVGLEAWPEGEMSWPLATGTWVHQWLAQALHRSKGGPSLQDFPAQVRAAAERERHRVERLAEAAGIQLYPWWNDVWGQACAVALSLAEELAPQLRDRLFLFEHALPRPCPVTLPGTTSADFELRGKIDLLLLDPGAAEIDPTTNTFTDASAWVIDFKTGPAKALTKTSLGKGRGLQTMLYALALEKLGAVSVAISIQTSARALRPQVQIEQVKTNRLLFQALERMHRDGIFGMKPPPDSDYGVSPRHPLAMRPVPSEVLEAKWVLTHGAAIFPQET